MVINQLVFCHVNTQKLSRRNTDMRLNITYFKQYVIPFFLQCISDAFFHYFGTIVHQVPLYSLPSHFSSFLRLRFSSAYRVSFRFRTFFPHFPFLPSLLSSPSLPPLPSSPPQFLSPSLSSPLPFTFYNFLSNFYSHCVSCSNFLAPFFLSFFISFFAKPLPLPFPLLFSFYHSCLCFLFYCCSAHYIFPPF